MYFVNCTDNSLIGLKGFTTNSKGLPLTEVIKEDGTVDWFELNYVNREFKERFSRGVRDFDLESISSEFNKTLDSNGGTPIADIRIEQGFKSGLIDYGKGALVEIDGIWHDGKTPTEIRSQNEAKNYLRDKVEVVPCITESQLREMDEAGQVIVNGKVLATRSKDEGELVESWKLKDSGRAMSGDSLRVLHHLNVPLAITNSYVSGGQLYHGLTSHSDACSGFDSKPLSSSAQGAALYTTKSIHEAITVYANPKSFEVSGKRYAVTEDEKDRVGGVNSHLMILRARGDNSVYSADFNKDGGIKTLSDIPSPHAVIAATDLYKNGSNDFEVDIACKAAVSELLNAATQYDCYVAMNELNRKMLSLNGEQFVNDGGVISKLLASMGYDALDITPPTPEQLKMIGNLKVDLERPRSQIKDVVEDLKMAPKTMNILLDSHLSTMKSSIPAKLDKGHAIFFDQSKKPTVLSVMNLPTHTAVYTNEAPHPQEGYSDAFYKYEDKDESRFSVMNINLLRNAREIQFKELSGDDKPKVTSKNKLTI